jgi:hypothetical protein
VWAKSAGGSNHDSGKSIATDSSGNSYIIGYFNTGSITFGAYTLTNFANDSTNDIFLVKYDALGNVVWARSAGGDYQDLGFGITLDASSNCYITGYYSSNNITFGSYTFTNSSFARREIFVAKYDSSGNVIWAKSAGGPNDETGWSIKVDNNRNVFVGGIFSSDPLIFAQDTLPAFGSQTFLFRYDALGNEVRGRCSSGWGFNEILSIALDSRDNCYVTGIFDGDLNLGTFSLVNPDFTRHDIFIAKYDAGGNVLWAKGAGKSKDDFGYAITVDNNGNCYTTGSFESDTISFDGITLINHNTNYTGDFFIVKHDSLGNVLWARSAGGSNNDEGWGMAGDGAGNNFVTGTFADSSITFGSHTLINQGSYNTFAVKYDALGNAVWAISGGGSNYDKGNGISLDGSGNCYVTGILYNSTNSVYGTDTLHGVYFEDVFVAKLSTAVGVEEKENQYSFSLFPNPAKNTFTIKLNSQIKNAVLEIYNVLGEKVYSEAISHNLQTINFNFPSSIYFVKVGGVEKYFVQKLVVE